MKIIAESKIIYGIPIYNEDIKNNIKDLIPNIRNIKI